MAGKKKCNRRKPYKTPKANFMALMKRPGGYHSDKRDKIALVATMQEISEIKDEGM